MSTQELHPAEQDTELLELRYRNLIDRLKRRARRPIEANTYTVQLREQGANKEPSHELRV